MKFLSKAGSFSVSTYARVGQGGGGVSATRGRVCGPGLGPGSALQVNPAEKRTAGGLRPRGGSAGPVSRGQPTPGKQERRVALRVALKRLSGYS